MKNSLLILLLFVLGACGGSDSGDGGNVRPGTLQFEGTSYDVSEGDVVNIIVTRSGGSSGVVSVDYATTDGTATAGTDYPARSGTVRFGDGVSGNQTISIPIIDDGSFEFAEAFTVTLSNVSGATLGTNSSATVNIVNDAAGLPITDGNAQNIAVAVLEAITSTVDVINILDVIGLPVVAATNSGKGNAMVQAISANIIACDTGEATVTWDDADNNFAISTGDTFDIEFTMCFFADTETTFDGPASLTNIIVSGDPFNQIAPWRLALTIGFDDLSAADNGGTAVIDGGLDVDLTSEDNVMIELSIATASLTAHQWFLSETLSDYSLAETLDLNTLTREVRASGTYTDFFLGGNVTFETLQDFVIIGDDNPSAGQLQISDGSSSVLVTVIDNISVELGIDIDLDGMIDLTITVTWAELDVDGLV